MSDDDSTTTKAAPDTGALSVGNFASRVTQKVQLDIDDALFLETPDEDKLPEEVVKKEVTIEEAPKPVKLWQRRPVQISVAVLLLLVLAFAAYLYFTSAPPPQVAVVDEPTVVVVPSPESISGEPEFQIRLAPFMVEQRESNTVHFLQAHFTAVTRSKDAAGEAQDKVLILRDAIFYYLRNKTHQFLIDPQSAAIIKQDLLDVVNGYLSKGKIDTFLFENYLVE